MTRATAMYGFSALIVVGAIGAWAVTGREGYTRWPDAKLAQSDVQPSALEDDLLESIGFDIDNEPIEQPNIESRFALGLVPGGFDPKHLPSVATATAGAVVISSFAAITTLRRRRKHQLGKAAQP